MKTIAILNLKGGTANKEQHERLLRNLRKVMRNELTPRQRQNSES